jgi:hypothetical protein
MAQDSKDAGAYQEIIALLERIRAGLDETSQSYSEARDEPRAVDMHLRGPVAPSLTAYGESGKMQQLSKAEGHEREVAGSVIKLSNGYYASLMVFKAQGDIGLTNLPNASGCLNAIIEELRENPNNRTSKVLAYALLLSAMLTDVGVAEDATSADRKLREAAKIFGSAGQAWAAAECHLYRAIIKPTIVPIEGFNKKDLLNLEDLEPDPCIRVKAIQIAIKKEKSLPGQGIASRGSINWRPIIQQLHDR